MSHIHIPDGVLPLWLWGLGWLLTLAMVGICGRIAERTDARRRVPLVAVVSALMIVAMSSEVVPLAYHVNLTVIGGVLLGPILAPIAAFIVEVVLALLGHGGVTVLGLNTVIVAAEMVLGWALFRGLVAIAGRIRVKPAAFVATVLTLAATTTLLLGIVAVGGTQAAQRETGALDPSTLRFENPLSSGVFSVGLFSGGEGDGEAEDSHASAGGKSAQNGGFSVGRFAAVVYTLGPPGWMLEALLTAWLLGYVARVRPSLLWRAGRPAGPNGDDETAHDAEEVA